MDVPNSIQQRLIFQLDNLSIGKCDLHIIANGEFYDFEQIQRDLKQLGYQLQTDSDSEIALHLYDEFGSNCLHHLRGEFAFVIFDEPHQLLFPARDR